MAVQLQVNVDQRDIDRAARRLDKISGKPLHERMRKAIQAGLSLLVGPIRGLAPARTGRLRASVKVRALKRRAGEVAAYAVGPTAPHAHLVIRPHRLRNNRMSAANPFVDRAVRPLVGTVDKFIDDHITALGRE